MSSLPVPKPNPGPRERRVADRSDRPPTAGGTALAIAPERRSTPAQAPMRRPRLRVVDETRISAATRRKRNRALVIMAGLVTVVSIFALASFHAMLLSGQSRLDRLNQDVVAERIEYESLRQKVAELESPGRIVTAAQDQLGMVPPAEVKWLVPTVTAEADPGTPRPGEVASADGAVGAPWATVKPFLGGKR